MPFGVCAFAFYNSLLCGDVISTRLGLFAFLFYFFSKQITSNEASFVSIFFRRGQPRRKAMPVNIVPMHYFHLLGGEQAGRKCRPASMAPLSFFISALANHSPRPSQGSCMYISSTSSFSNENTTKNFHPFPQNEHHSPPPDGPIISSLQLALLLVPLDRC